MTGQSSERALDASEVYGVLAAHGFGGGRSETHGIVLALQSPLRVVWANRAATTLFGTDEASGLNEQLFRSRGRDGIAGLVGRLVPGGGGRTERLRLLKGFHARTVTASVGCARLADGTDVLVVAVPMGESETADHEAHVDALKRPLPAITTPMPAATPAHLAPYAEGLVPDVARPGWIAERRLSRFLWQCDRAGHLLHLSGPAGDLAALDPATALGHAFAALAHSQSPTEAAALQAVLAGSQAFSGLRLTWPLATREGTVPVTLGATPMRGKDGEAGGFRGFGVIDFTRFVAASGTVAPRDGEAGHDPASAMEETTAIVDGVVPDDGVIVSPAPASLEIDSAETPRVVDEVREADPEGPDEAGVRAAERLRFGTGVRAAYSSAKIVTLHPTKLVSPIVQTVTAPIGADETPSRRRHDHASPLDDEATASDLAAELSSVEQFNFDEIARALRNAAADTIATGFGTAVSSAADDNAAVLAALPVPVLVDRKGRIVYANAAFLALTGYASARAIDKAGGRDYLLGGLDAAQVAGVEEERAFPIVDAGGSIVSVMGRIAVIPWGGAPAEMLTLRPASDRVAEVQSLQMDVRRREDERADYRALIDRASDAIVTVDSQGRLLMMNATAERLFARDERGTAGESIGVLLTPDCQSAALGAIFAAGTAGPEAEDARIRVTGRRPDASTIALAMMLRALGPGKIGIVLHDETEVDALREDLQQSRAEADQTGTLRSAFLAKISHEVRTPLNAIIGFAEIMLDERFGPIGNPRYKDYLGDIRQAGQHVIDLVADLLDLSAMQAGRHDLDVVAADVNRAVTDCVADLQGNAHRDRVIVRMSLLPQLPSAMVDKRALRQILDNVLTNAIGFNEPGGQVIVSTGVTEAGGVAIKVRDTGVGMSDAELAVAMEPFRQISTGKPGGGSGLGLPLTRALVDANHATMAIKSRKGEGTLVEIVLRPVSEKAVSAPAA